MALDWYVARLGPKDEFPGLHLGWAAGVWSICSGSRRYFFAPAKAVSDRKVKFKVCGKCKMRAEAS